MKILAVAVVSLAFLCLLPFSQGKLYFTGDIETDENEVFRVPAQDDVNDTESYHDFKKRVTVTKDLTRKVCYIANMDPSMPSPKKLKTDLGLAASQPGELPITTQEHLELMTGSASRLLLTKEILDFCGALPIYKAKVYKNPVNGENGTLTVRTTARHRRQASFVINEFTSCIATGTKGQGDPLKFIKAGKCMSNPHWDLKCSIRNLNRNCYYYVTCKNTQKVWPAIEQDWVCIPVHRGATNPHCCDYQCPPGTGK